MSDPLPTVFVGVASLAAGTLVFSGFRLYRTALATVGAVAGILAGWYLGGLLGPIEVAAAGALLGGIIGAVLAAPLEAALRLLGGGVAAAALVWVAVGGTASGGATALVLTGGAFVVGAVAALLLHRPLVISAFAACGGLLVAAAGLAAGAPELVDVSLDRTIDGLTDAMNARLPAVLVIAATSVVAGFLLQSDHGEKGVSGSRPGLRSGGALLSLILAAGLLLSLHPVDALPGPALAVTGIGPMSWPVAVLLLPPALALAHRGSVDGGSLRGWTLGVAFGIAVGVADAALGAALPGGGLGATGFVSTFADGTDELRLVKAGWTLLVFPLLFSSAVLLPAGRRRGRSSRDEGDDEG